MDGKKVAVLAVLALILFFVLTAPREAADAATTVGVSLKNGAIAIVTFLKNLFA